MSTTQNMTVTGEQLTEWANLAREAKAGWGLAYISDVYQVARLIGAVECSLEAFKLAIVSRADTRGCLRRCDLVAALDVSCLAQSEATYRTASYHMVSR